MAFLRKRIIVSRGFISAVLLTFLNGVEGSFEDESQLVLSPYFQSFMAPSVADNPPQCNDPDEEESLHDEVTYPQLPVVINLMSSSGSDSEEEWTNGYELLPQDPENEHSSLTEQVRFFTMLNTLRLIQLQTIPNLL